MNQSDVVIPMSASQIRTNKLKLVGIFAVAVVPVLLAFGMYYGGFAIPSHKTNKGDLIWPPIAASVLDAPSESLSQLVDTSPNWYLMLAGGQLCDAHCEELAHTVRQVNVAMGREMDRVGRVMVTPFNSSDPVSLKERYPELAFVHASEPAISGFLDEASRLGVHQSSGQWAIWLVDPHGNIVMHYGADHDGYDMIDDLKKLLKLSKIG